MKSYKGFYSYSFLNNTEGYHLVDFVLYSENMMDSFTGTIVDEETKEIFAEGEIIVKGFIENDFISFVKTYPKAYWIDKKGSAVLSDNPKPHIVEYSGFWDESMKKYQGTFYVVLSEKLVNRKEGTYEEMGYSGLWELSVE